MGADHARERVGGRGFDASGDGKRKRAFGEGTECLKGGVFGFPPGHTRAFGQCAGPEPWPRASARTSFTTFFNSKNSQKLPKTPESKLPQTPENSRKCWEIFGVFGSFRESGLGNFREFWGVFGSF